MNPSIQPFARLVLLFLLGAGSGLAWSQNELRDSLFAVADDALKAANEAHANVLAPTSYGKAAESYRSAEEKLRRGRSIESIRGDLNDAVADWRRAVEAAAIANVTLTTAIQARNDAEAANARSFAGEEWSKAEERFAAAASRLESGNVNAARSRARDAEALFRTAELSAIKANYLDETRRLIAEAKENRVERYAPKTLARAEMLLATAENALNRSRYDTDEPRSLARQAKYEAKHAAYLAASLRPVRDRDVTLEDFALAYEAPVVRIAAELDLVAELDEGFDRPTAEIVAGIEALQKDAYELTERRNEIAGLESEIQRLEGELGVQSDRLAEQEAQRRRVRQVESLFEVNEAQVFTQGQNVLIRPIGLVFPSGSDQIEAQYFGILRKVQDATRVFPGSLIVIEGHTDSFGGDEANFVLSENRAAAVRTYLLANMPDLDPASVESIGFGEARPVANNETPEGRARNRRIDVVIRPAAGSATVQPD